MMMTAERRNTFISALDEYHAQIQRRYQQMGYPGNMQDSGTRGACRQLVLSVNVENVSPTEYIEQVHTALTNYQAQLESAGKEGVGVVGSYIDTVKEFQFTLLEG